MKKDEWGEFNEKDIAIFAERMRKAIDHSIMESLLPSSMFARRPIGIQDSTHIEIKEPGRFMDRRIKAKLTAIAVKAELPPEEHEDFFIFVQRKIPQAFLKEATVEVIENYFTRPDYAEFTQTTLDEEEEDDMPLKEQTRVQLDPIFSKPLNPITLEEIIKAEPRIATVLNQALQLRHHADKAKVHEILMDALDPLIGERSDTFILQSPEATMVVIKAVRQRCGCGG